MPPKRTTRASNKSKAASAPKETQKVDEETPETKELEPWQKATTIYDFTAKDIDGNEVNFEKYKDKVCIIVNVASRCGHTKSNYEQLVQLYDKHNAENGLQILAFPCNQFGSQETGTCEKIKEFTQKRNVKFDVFEKVKVNGKDAHPLWKFLTSKIAGPHGNPIKWNFTKFIINSDGEPVERHAPSVKPLTLEENLQKLW